MKLITILFGFFLLGGCAINITPKSFIYQDKVVESGLNLQEIQGELTQDPSLTAISEVSVTTQDGITLKGIKFTHSEATVNILLFGGNGMKISASSDILNHFSLVPANLIWFD